MKQIKLTEECIRCLVDKFTRQYPKNTDEIMRLGYTKRVLRAVADAQPWQSAPEIVEKINIIQEEMFGKSTDYTEIKRHFNRLMLSCCRELEDKINSSADPLAMAVKFSMMGNYIDFGTMENVEEEKLFAFLDKAEDIQLDMEEYSNFTEDLKKAQNIVLLADNCGEIVLDKLLISTIRKLFPHLCVYAVVRGMPVLNDATMEDAKESGLEDVAHVCDNGTRIAGTCLDRISPKALEIIDGADVVISKGQGNFETMRYCRKNVYYMFMCKCSLFAQKFGVPLHTGMFVNDLRMM